MSPGRRLWLMGESPARLGERDLVHPNYLRYWKMKPVYIAIEVYKTLNELLLLFNSICTSMWYLAVLKFRAERTFSYRSEDSSDIH